MGARIVGITALNLNEYLPLMVSALGRNVSSVADGANFNPPLHHLMCLSAAKQPHLRATAEACRQQANMFHAIAVVGCSEYESAGILEVAAMPSMVMQTTTRGTDCLIIAGTLEQWAGALYRGCQMSVPKEVREAYNGVYQEFTRLKLGGLFSMDTKPQSDNTFTLIEHKR